MTRVSPLEAAMQAIDLLRDIRDGDVKCLMVKDEESPVAGCDCYICRLRRKANNIVDRYDGEDV